MKIITLILLVCSLYIKPAIAQNPATFLSEINSLGEIGERIINNATFTNLIKISELDIENDLIVIDGPSHYENGKVYISRSFFNVVKADNSVAFGFSKHLTEEVIFHEILIYRTPGNLSICMETSAQERPDNGVTINVAAYNSFYLNGLPQSPAFLSWRGEEEAPALNT